MPKIEPTFLSPTGIDLRKLDADAVRATQRLVSRGFEAYLVGGCVRDLLLGREPKDYDIATSARPPQVKRTFPRNCRIIGRRFKLAHLHFDRNTKILECSTFRQTPQIDSEDDLLITRDNEFGNAEEDAMRRDFTVNGLFLDPIKDCILDYTDGLSDVRARVIRTIGDPRVRFREDPIRLLRAAKFAGRLGFTIEPETFAAMAETAGDLVRAAPPRVFEEILRLLRGGHALDSFQLLRDVGALKFLVPVLAEFLATARHDQRVGFWRLLEALDRTVNDGYVPQNAVLLGVLLVWPVLAKAEESPDRSHSSIAEELLGPLSQSLKLPRRDAGCLKRICGVQHRFTATDERKRFRTGGFVRGPYFPEALDLFELRVLAEDPEADGETLDRWRDLAHGNRRDAAETDDVEPAHDEDDGDTEQSKASREPAAREPAERGPAKTEPAKRERAASREAPPSARHRDENRENDDHGGEAHGSEAHGGEDHGSEDHGSEDHSSEDREPPVAGEEPQADTDSGDGPQKRRRRRRGRRKSRSREEETEGASDPTQQPASRDHQPATDEQESDREAPLRDEADQPAAPGRAPSQERAARHSRPDREPRRAAHQDQRAASARPNREADDSPRFAGTHSDRETFDGGEPTEEDGGEPRHAADPADGAGEPGRKRRRRRRGKRRGNAEGSEEARPHQPREDDAPHQEASRQEGRFDEIGDAHFGEEPPHEQASGRSGTPRDSGFPARSREREESAWRETPAGGSAPDGADDRPADDRTDGDRPAKRRRRRRGGKGGEGRQAGGEQRDRGEQRHSGEQREVAHARGGDARDNEHRGSQDRNDQGRRREGSDRARGKSGRETQGRETQGHEPQGRDRQARDKPQGRDNQGRRSQGSPSPQQKRRDKRRGGGSPRDVDVVPRSRDRRGKVEVIEPPPLDLSAFDVELDPKRVPTFGSIVEGKGRPKRRVPRVRDDGGDDYRPPPPPGSEGGGPPAPREPDTFGDW